MDAYMNENEFESKTYFMIHTIYLYYFKIIMLNRLFEVVKYDIDNRPYQLPWISSYLVWTLNEKWDNENRELFIDRTLIRWYNNTIKDLIEKYKFPIQFDPHTINWKDIDFDNMILIWFTNIWTYELCMLSSIQNSYYQWKKIVPIIIPSLNYNLFTDEDWNCLWALKFYMMIDGVIRFITNSRIIKICSLKLTSFDNKIKCNDIPQRLLINSTAHQKLNNKIENKKIIIWSWLLTANFSEIDWSKDIESQIIQFCNNHNIQKFMIKAWNSHGWRNIKAFNLIWIWEATTFINEIFLSWDSVHIEERINPIFIKDKDWNRLDWNIRLLVTFSDKPEIIDWEIRYWVYHDWPINKCQGAKICEINHIFEKLWLSQDSIIEIWKKISKIFFDEFQKKWISFKNYIWIDIIISDKWIYIIEVNFWNVWWLWTLFEIRKKPIDGIEKQLIPHMQQRLYENYLINKSTKKLNRRLSLQLFDHIKILNTLWIMIRQYLNNEICLSDQIIVEYKKELENTLKLYYQDPETHFMYAGHMVYINHEKAMEQLRFLLNKSNNTKQDKYLIYYLLWITYMQRNNYEKAYYYLTKIDIYKTDKTILSLNIENFCYILWNCLLNMDKLDEYILLIETHIPLENRLKYTFIYINLLLTYCKKHLKTRSLIYYSKAMNIINHFINKKNDSTLEFIYIFKYELEYLAWNYDEAIACIKILISHKNISDPKTKENALKFLRKIYLKKWQLGKAWEVNKEIKKHRKDQLSDIKEIVSITL